MITKRRKKMIIAIFKQYVNGKWREVTEPLYQVGDVIRANNGKTYKVIQVNGSKITLEEERK